MTWQYILKHPMTPFHSIIWHLDWTKCRASCSTHMLALSFILLSVPIYLLYLPANLNLSFMQCFRFGDQFFVYNWFSPGFSIYCWFFFLNHTAVMTFSISPLTNFYLVFCFTNLLYCSCEYETENGNYSSQEKKNRILALYDLYWCWEVV